MTIGDRVRLRIERLAFGGDAIGHADDGRVVFVDRGVPGDRVEVEVREVKRSFARATLREVLEPSPNRVAPLCRLADRCGGCPWQEVDLELQRATKQAIVERALDGLGGTIEPLLAPTASAGYRTRARLAVEDGRVGFHGRRSSRVVDVDTCPALDPALDAALQRVRHQLSGHFGSGGSIAGLIGRGGAVHLAIDGLDDAGRTAARSLLGTASIAGLLLDGRLVVGARSIDTAPLGEPSLWAAADGFAQASEVGNLALRHLVSAWAAAAGLRVLELHAGDGNFTRDLLGVAGEVIAVEGAPAAAARLRRNLPAATVYAEPAERVAARLAGQGQRFDLVLLDPPRAGAAALVQPLARLAPRIVYVSCDPITLSRDGHALVAAGYRLLRARPLDLMPHTAHVETVAVFTR